MKSMTDRRFRSDAHTVQWLVRTIFPMHGAHSDLPAVTGISGIYQCSTGHTRTIHTLHDWCPAFICRQRLKPQKHALEDAVIEAFACLDQMPRSAGSHEYSALGAAAARMDLESPAARAMAIGKAPAQSTFEDDPQVCKSHSIGLSMHAGISFPQEPENHQVIVYPFLSGYARTKCIQELPFS